MEGSHIFFTNMNKGVINMDFLHVYFHFSLMNNWGEEWRSRVIFNFVRNCQLFNVAIPFDSVTNSIQEFQLLLSLFVCILLILAIFMSVICYLNVILIYSFPMFNHVKHLFMSPFFTDKYFVKFPYSNFFH